MICDVLQRKFSPETMYDVTRPALITRQTLAFRTSQTYLIPNFHDSKVCRNVREKKSLFVYFKQKQLEKAGI